MVFTVQKSSTEEENDEWEGLIRSMKKHVSKQNEKVAKQVKETKNEIVFKLNSLDTKVSDEINRLSNS